MSRTARHGRLPAHGAETAGLMALVGGAVLIALGAVAAGGLISATEAVRAAAATLEASSLSGVGWYAGDGSAVSRGHGGSELVRLGTLLGVPVLAASLYGLGLCARTLRRPGGGEPWRPGVP